ncbi:MAG: serine/threonine protein phosphatase PrpC [Patiriisocius sp.]|jgi:serine/threonine protein phosphatase PrpC
MKIKSFSNIGTRNNNEDSLGTNTNPFIVCDGMGGHGNGEIASKFVVDEVLHLIEKKQLKITKETITEILETVQGNLNKKLETQPELLKMGTTFTGVFFAKESVFVAHIGDSRVYVVRPSEEKIWHTWDHSLVGGLMKSGEITREKGRLHPMSHRISKAITANDKSRTVTSDIVQFNSIKKGDLFFLCSDGVNEAWKEHELMALLCNTDLTNKEKLKQIEDQCEKESRDNNTVILLEIETADVLDDGGKNEGVEWISLHDFKLDYNLHLENLKREEDEFVDEVMLEPEEVDHTIEIKKKAIFTTRKFIIALVVLVIAVVLLFNLL